MASDSNRPEKVEENAPEVRAEPQTDAGANDAPAENVTTFVQSGPSATSPVRGDEYLGAFSADFEKRDDGWRAAGIPEPLPGSVRNSRDLGSLNPNARDNLGSVVIRPGHRFTAPGRYHDVTNVERKYDVEPGQVSPDGLYLVSERYLLSAFDRGKAE